MTSPAGAWPAGRDNLQARFSPPWSNSYHGRRLLTARDPKDSFVIPSWGIKRRRDSCVVSRFRLLWHSRLWQRPS